MAVRRACCLIRNEPHYRREAFDRGLVRSGFVLSSDASRCPRDGDMLVIWNRYGPIGDHADRWEKFGGKVLVCENGYYGVDEKDRQFYAIAVHAHNGAGWWPTGDGSRLDALHIEFKPRRIGGDHILIAASRSIGPAWYAQPPGWETEMARRLKRTMDRPIRVRPHPGRHVPLVTLAADLRDAHAMVTWSSNAATEALIAGIPVCYCGPFIITAGAAIPGIDEIDSPPLPDRRPAFERLAWAQWSVAEIESGLPFSLLANLDAPSL